MQWLDLTLPTPAENLACDEALLDLCESGWADEALRFWESAIHFVVVGYGNKVEAEVNIAACRKESVPILRRCTGGGTVLQGPGCLNYSLVLRIDSRPGLESITSANCRIMERNAVALSKLLGRIASVEGFTDLAFDGRKFSGNAQRRKKTHLLFHGTFLTNFDVKLIERYLRAPSREPDYRQERNHLDFVQSIGAAADDIKNALRAEWEATEPSPELPKAAIAELVAQKYSRDDWNLKF